MNEADKDSLAGRERENESRGCDYAERHPV